MLKTAGRMPPFVKNTLTILRGSLIGQGIVFVSLPLLSRLIPPAAFGTLQSLQAVLSVLVIVCSLRLEIAILSADEEDVHHIISVCIALCMLTSLIVLFGLMLLWLVDPSKLAKFGGAAFLLPFSLLFSGIGQVMTYIGLRLESFAVNSNGKIAQSIVFVGASALTGVLWPTAFTLNLADVFGRAALVAASMRGDIAKLLSKRIPLGRQSFLAAYKFRYLPQYSMPSAIINILGAAFTSMMLLAIFDAKVAGNYAMIERALGAPVSILGGAASQAFIAALSRSNRIASESQVLFKQIIWSNGLIAILPTIVLMVAGPTLVPWILGADWKLAGTYAQILAPMLFISFLAVPVNMTLVISGRQAWQLLWDTARLLVVALMWFVVARGNYSAIVAVGAFSAIASLFYVAHIILSYIALAPKHATLNADSNP